MFHPYHNKNNNFPRLLIYTGMLYLWVGYGLYNLLLYMNKNNKMLYNQLNNQTLQLMLYNIHLHHN
ncbi:MAG: hypothetical protein CMI60_03290 [Parvibaculum sp.]|nr:hypothetical protein [Parvibaculum sp.]